MIQHVCDGIAVSRRLIYIVRYWNMMTYFLRFVILIIIMLK